MSDEKDEKKPEDKKDEKKSEDKKDEKKPYVGQSDAGFLD